MRVAILLSGLGAGGAERVVALLAREWIERGWDVALICFEKADTASYHTLPDRVRIIRRSQTRSRSGLGSLLELLNRIVFLRRSISRERPDVVVSFLTKINVLALLANLGRDTPLIICERNNPERQDVRRGWRRLQNRLAHRATLVLQTMASRRAFDDVALGQVLVIPNPVEPSASLADPGMRTIVAAGRLVDQKGFDLLVDAFSRIASAHQEWNLIIWGDGPLRGALESRRDGLGLNARISLPGLTDRPRGWTSSGSIFVLSSRYEGFPNVLVEAMSGGMAVVAVDCPFGPSEIVRHGEDGYLVRPDSVEALASALDRLMAEETLRCRLGSAARRNVDRFSIDRVIAQWDEALSLALRSRRMTSGMAEGAATVEESQ